MCPEFCKPQLVNANETGYGDHLHWCRASVRHLEASTKSRTAPRYPIVTANDLWWSTRHCRLRHAHTSDTTPIQQAPQAQRGPQTRPQVGHTPIQQADSRPRPGVSSPLRAIRFDLWIADIGKRLLGGGSGTLKPLMRLLQPRARELEARSGSPPISSTTPTPPPAGIEAWGLS